MNKLIIISLVLLAGCNLFETRSPEEPDSRKLSFPPATSTNVLIDNFRNSIIEKSIDNYSDCFANSEDQSFSFSPSADAYSAYTSYFTDWNYADERRYFQSLVSFFNSEEKISLLLTNPVTNYVSPDSTLYSAEYDITLPSINQSMAVKYLGKIQLTLIPLADGTWKILRWLDSPNNQADTVFPNWSILKAKFHN